MNVLLALPVVLACWPCRLAAMALTFPLVKVPPAALATLPTIAPALAAWPLPHPALPPCLPCRPAPTPQKREGFSLLAFLKTPYGMMAGFMLFSMFILPKLKVGGTVCGSAVGGPSVRRSGCASPAGVPQAAGSGAGAPSCAQPDSTCRPWILYLMPFLPVFPPAFLPACRPCFGFNCRLTRRSTRR